MTERVTVYRFKKWDNVIGDDRVARRWATVEAISRTDGAIIRESATEIDASNLDSTGMTASDFDPFSLQAAAPNLSTSRLSGP
jgi:hypothetical protein